MMALPNAYEVVISGVAGLYPESDDVDELWERLINKEDLVTVDGRRWIPGEFDVPSGSGKVKNPEKFDMTFFGIHRRLCEKMDPYTRLQCEQSYRAVCDAGVNPRFLDGSNTAVIMTSFSSEPEHDMGASLLNQGTYNVLAFSRTMQANRISYFLNLKGPSFQMDCSGCGGVQGVQYACDLIASGMCTAAIVGSTSLLNKPEPSFHYQAMGRLSEDSVTRCFSSDATGYARAESCVSIFLQRKDHAKRIYGTILAAEVDCYGSKEAPFSEAPQECLETFLKETYNKAKVDPNEVMYLEAYGSASKPLDALELNCISRLMLKNRTEPLLIGSIKSNLGHTEGASALVSLTKLLLALDRGTIPPNINYKDPNPDVPMLISGQLKVVTEPEPLQGNIVAMTELGVSGIYSHLILKRHEKIKPNEANKNKSLPFLVTMSGRSEEKLNENLKKLEKCGIDEELVVLMNSLYKDGIKPHVCRGYTVIGDEPNTYSTVGNAPSGDKRPIWFMYSGMGSQWPTMAKTLMELPIFANAINKCHEVLLPKGVNLLEIVTKDDAGIFDIILNSFVGIAAVQIGLTDVLKAVGIHPDGIIGHSVGELGCAYADNCVTAEQMILAAHARGRASIEADLIKGMMAAVGLGYNAIKNSLPDSIEVACHNSKDSCTLSGPADDMKDFIAQLKSKGTFAKLVNVANIAYHSQYIRPAAPALLKYLKEIIPEPKRRSSKWISSSNLEQDWESELAQFSSAEYHTNNLLSSVLFEEASAHIPSNAIVIEIAPHGLLQAIVKRSIPQAVHVPLTSRFDSNNLMFLLGALGKLYLNGVPVDIQPLYPNVEYPVGRSTPAISPLIDWLRDENFFLRRSLNDPDYLPPLCKYVTINKSNDDFNTLSSYKINKRSIVPGTFFYQNIIDIFMNAATNVSVKMNEVTFPAYAEIHAETQKEIRFKLMKGTGSIVVNDCENERIIATCQMVTTDEVSITSPADLETMENIQGSVKISGETVQSFMTAMGVECDPSLHAIDSVIIGDERILATVHWNGNVGDFLFCILSVVEFHETKTHNSLRLFHKAREFAINLPRLKNSPSKTVTMEYDIFTKTIQCDDVQIQNIECKNPEQYEFNDSKCVFTLEQPKFVPYDNNNTTLSHKEQFDVSTQLIQENSPYDIKIIEIGQNAIIHEALDNVTSSIKYSSKSMLSSYSTEKDFLQQGTSGLFEKGIWLVFETAPSNEMLRCLSIVNDAFITIPKNDQIQIENIHTTILYEYSVDGTRYQLVSVKEKYQKRQYEVVNLTDNYVSHLQTQLSQAKEYNSKTPSVAKTIILWGEIDSFITMDRILEETNNLENNDHLHYWLFLGTAPEFNAQDLDFKKQIERGVKVNISVDGRWGSLRLFAANEGDQPTETIQSSHFYYPLSAIVEKHNLRSLGLNLKNDTTESGHAELGMFDYVTAKAMGIGSYDPHSKEFKPDSILSWQKPSHWSDEEAATVPCLYSLASYILNYNNNCEYTNDKTILVNNALTPFSQALISLALYENLTVYASVYGEEEKQVLLKMFPRIKPENIYDCSFSSFHVEVNRDTGGIYKVINNFNDQHMIEPCSKCVKYLGVLVFLDQTVMTEEAKLGMYKFQEEIVAQSASVEILINSTDDVKTKIKENLTEALRKGALMPIQTVLKLHPSTLNTDAVNYLKKGSNKMVISAKDLQIKNENKIYLKEEQGCHVVIEGKIHFDLSLDILEWLLKRGASKVILFMRQNHPFESTSLRLLTLRNHYKSAEIDVRFTNQLSSKPTIEKLVKECLAPKPAMVFFLGSGLKDKIELFDGVLSTHSPNSHIICIGKGGENVCERRKKKSLPSLYIRCSTSNLPYTNLPNHLDGLINTSSSVPVVFINKCIIQNRRVQGLSADLMHLPSSRKELHKLVINCSKRATFVELLTASPKRIFNRELYPVFLIPGLKADNLHKMASHLYCPALEARLPFGPCNIDQAAADLTLQMLAMPLNMFTIVADDWGCVLALHVAAKLEAFSKSVRIILLDAAPASTIQLASRLLNDEIALLGNYLPISSQDKSNVQNLNWEQKLEMLIDNSELCEMNKKMTGDGLKLLRSRLQGVLSSKPPINKLKGQCHIVQLTLTGNVEEHGLKGYMNKDPVVHEIDASTETVEEIIAREVDTLLMFEYKDAANPPIEEYCGMNVVKKPHWQSTLLYRVSE